MDAIRRPVRIAAVITLMLAACQSDRAPEGITEAAPDLLATDAAACAAEGGRWGSALGSSLFVCYRTPRDAGKQCREADDCSTHCLARSRTCAPVTPFYGCHEVLTGPGQVATLCIE